MVEQIKENPLLQYFIGTRYYSNEPPFDASWFQQFDNCWKNPPQKIGFRHYLGGLLGQSEMSKKVGQFGPTPQKFQ